MGNDVKAFLWSEMQVLAIGDGCTHARSQGGIIYFVLTKLVFPLCLKLWVTEGLVDGLIKEIGCRLVRSDG